MKKRKSTRLKNYDYSSSGWYFITICAQNRECLFGKIINNKMKLNKYGKIVDKKINELKKYKNIGVDVYCIMPNHIHMIIIINSVVGAGFMPARTGFMPARTGFMPARKCDVKHSNRATTRVAPTTVGGIIGAFKSLTTREYINGVKINNWQPFNKRIWQRNYYEHIIRDEKSLNKIREYIRLNPKMWDRDRNNPNLQESV